ncbi:MAG: hypothetical protein IJ796_01820 [Lachnospiraceae bacterium]|nr:hypothetical protein [Lachnospiraceae bacterium]
MKKFNVKKLLTAAGTALLAGVCLAGCGKTAKATDPALAKQGVYKYSAVDLGIDGDSYYDVTSIVSSGDKAYAVINQYDDNTGGYVLSLYEIGLDGSSSSSVSLEAPDFSEFRPEGYENAGSSGYDDGEYVIYDDEVMPVATEEAVTEEAVTEESAVTEEVVTDEAVTGEGTEPGNTESSIMDYWENFYYNNITVIGQYIIGSCEFSNSYTEFGNYVYNDDMFLTAWNLDGSFAWGINLTKEFDFEYGYINSICAADSDILVLFNGSSANGGEERKLITVEASGNIKDARKLGPELNISRIVKSKDGRLIAFYYDNEYNNAVAYIDQNTLSLGDPVAIPSAVTTGGYSAIQIGFDTDFIISNQQGIYKFNIGDEDLTICMDPINSDLNGYSVGQFAFIDDTHFVGCYSNMESYRNEIALFTYVDPATIADKKVLSMATYYLSYDVRKRVVDFNKESDDYRITIRDYSQYATNEDWYAGYTRLNNDILAGDIPDILAIAPNENIDYSSFAKKGILKDIDELLAKDEELSGNTYLTNVFDAFAINGKHYMIVPSFTYNSYIASKSVVGDKTSLTIPEFVEIFKQYPEMQPFEYTTREQMLWALMSYDGSEFIDPETGRCEFDSDDFSMMLEYIATLPEEISYGDDYYYEDFSDSFVSGKVLYDSLYLSSIDQFQIENYSRFYGDGVMVGFPTRNGQPAVLNINNTPFFIANGANTDGAWEFARYYLTEDYQNSLTYCIPVLESAFDAWAAKGLEKPYWEDENGEKIYYDNYYYVDGIENVIPVMTQEQIDSIKEMIRSCTKANYSNQQISSIIEEEASACFSGQKSASDVCKIIQSRTQLYINEKN